MIEVYVSDTSQACNTKIKDLKLSADSKVGGIIRASGASIATPDFEIRANDKVVVFALPDAIKSTLKYFS